MTSRVEIADVLRESLAGPLRSRSDLLETARAAGARDAVVRALERLPDRRFGDLRELWPCLPDLPIEA